MLLQCRVTAPTGGIKGCNRPDKQPLGLKESLQPSNLSSSKNQPQEASVTSSSIGCGGWDHHTVSPIWERGPKGPPAPSCFMAYKRAAAPTVWAVRRENPEWCKWQGDLLEQLPFFSNTTVASQLLLSSISVLLAKPFTIFAEFFVFLSKKWCMVELYLHKQNKLRMYL